MLYPSKDFEVEIELEKRREEGRCAPLLTGKWAVRCPRCWKLLRLQQHRRSSTPQVEPEPRLPPPAEAYHSISQRILHKISNFSFFVLRVSYRWLDLKMALHGLTLRKQKRTYLTTVLWLLNQLIQIQRVSNLSPFYVSSFLDIEACSDKQKKAQYLDFNLNNMLFYAALPFIIVS